jgi:hypothetical protein
MVSPHHSLGPNQHYREVSEQYDIPWWREFWEAHGGAGRDYPLPHRAEFPGNGDLYGDLAKAAHSDGLTGIAGMDSNRSQSRALRDCKAIFGRAEMVFLDSSGKGRRRF